MNELNNFAPFFVGQKVVYITGKCMAKDSIHVVRGVTQYSCGCWAIDIGESHNSRGCYCSKHNSDPIYTRKAYYQASSFRPLQEQKFPLISYKKVLETTPEVCGN